MKLPRVLLWTAVACTGAVSIAVIALVRGESINALWFLAAALSCYAIAYRFYSAWIAAKVLSLDDARPTPAERLNDGRDFVPTNRWVTFGHHFAAIAGPGPLIGPILAAQFGYLPGTLWILAGVVLGGAVQDFTILVCSMRRDGRSLGQMAREELGALGGAAALLGVFGIMIILIAVLGLVVVNAMFRSPWGTSTVAMTIPIALLMGLWLRTIRPGKVGEATAIGLVLLAGALFLGRWVDLHPLWGPFFTFTRLELAGAIIAYGFLASVLPVWLLLAPRDYLSTFVKLGTVAALALGIFALRPEIHLPAFTRFTDGTGPIFAGKVFPFAFITIACGAISGFHALIASGTTPKLLMRESDARMIGYGGMLLESFVAIMAMISAAVLDPGIYFAINSPAGVVGATPEVAVATISGWGFPVTTAAMGALTRQIGEETLFGRTGGAPCLAVGMAHIFSRALGGKAMALWYHFAIMFEALFILTTLDAGTRVGRFMLQDMLGNIWTPLGRTSWAPSAWLASVAVVGAWGSFLIQGILDPLGGINSLWPLFGISNQLLAATALAVATTILIRSGRGRYAFTTLLPLAWLLSVTMTAGWQKIFHPDPKIGFLAQAQRLVTMIQAGSVPAEKIAETRALIFNNRLDAAVTGIFMLLVAVIIAASIRRWVDARSWGGRPGRVPGEPIQAP